MYLNLIINIQLMSITIEYGEKGAKDTLKIIIVSISAITPEHGAAYNIIFYGTMSHALHKCIIYANSKDKATANLQCKSAGHAIIILLHYYYCYSSIDDAW